jgi:multidrug transporter EmrE-like cation transporter
MPMSNEVIYTIVFLVGVFISAVSQILLKTSSNKVHSSIIKEYLNPRVITAYTILLCASFLAVIAYRYIPLSYGVILESTAYIYVPVLSYIILKERVTVKKALGMAVIIAGILVFSYPL